MSACCPREVHEVMKLDRAEYLRATYFIGIQSLGDGSHFEMRNCRACHSTVAVEGELSTEAIEGPTDPLSLEMIARNRAAVELFKNGVVRRAA